MEWHPSTSGWNRLEECSFVSHKSQVVKGETSYRGIPHFSMLKGGALCVFYQKHEDLLFRDVFAADIQYLSSKICIQISGYKCRYIIYISYYIFMICTYPGILVEITKDILKRINFGH